MTLWILDRESTNTDILCTPCNVYLFLLLKKGEKGEGKEERERKGKREKRKEREEKGYEMSDRQRQCARNKKASTILVMFIKANPQLMSFPSSSVPTTTCNKATQPER